jgi:hypothetical protein
LRHGRTISAAERSLGVGADDRSGEPVRHRHFTMLASSGRRGGGRLTCKMQP